MLFSSRDSAATVLYLGGEKKEKEKKKKAVMYSMLFPENKGQMNAQHLLGSSNSELFIA